MAGKPPVVTKLDIVYKQIYQMFGYTQTDLRVKSNKPDIVHARQAFCYLARKCAEIKLLEIAKELNKDHTTIISSVRAMENKMATDYENSRDQMNKMIENLKFAF